jgi:hypothetical protein
MREQAALARFRQVLLEPDTLLAAWRDHDLFAEVGSTGLRYRAGAKNPAAIAATARRYEAQTHTRFPALLGALLAEVNGLDVEETGDGQVEMEEEATLEGVANGLLPVSELTMGETGDGFSGLVFGTAYGQAQVLLCPQGVVFSDGKGPSVVVAEDLAAFVIDWCRLGLSIEAVVGAHLE